MPLKALLCALAAVATLAAHPEAGRDAGDPIRLAWSEGDVAGGHITGFSGLGAERETYDERVELPPGTYWGPLIFIAIKNFERNASDGRLVFRTVVATPKPRVFDMEIVRQGESSIHRRGGKIGVVRFALRPTVNWLIDPIIRLFAPETFFFVQLGAPPGLVRFDGPRNFAEQKIRIE